MLAMSISVFCYFPVSYDSRVVIYERKMFIRLATEVYCSNSANGGSEDRSNGRQVYLFFNTDH